MKNLTKIQITEINQKDIPLNIYMDKFLLLRNARIVGDIENVNNTQLGRLIEAKKQGLINFIKIS